MIVFRYFFTLFSIYLSSRWAIRLLPGNPIDTILSETGTSLSFEELQNEFHLNEPFLKSTVLEIQNLLHLDFGRSLLSRQPVQAILMERIPSTAALALSSILIAFICSLFLGCLAAQPTSQIRRLADGFCTGFGAIAAALPTPWIGPIFILVFSVWIPILSVSNSLILPTATLSVGLIGFWSRLIRSRVRETLSAPFATAARARGLSEWTIAIKYGFFPASGSLFGYLGTVIGHLFAGAFVTETVFNRQGLGTLMVESVLSRDYPVVQGCIFASASFCLFGNFLGEFLKRWADPRTEAQP